MKNCGNMETIVFDRDKLMKDYSEAAKEVVILPSVMGGQYYPGNDKYYEKLNMGEDKLKELRKKYIGQRVYAGGELKGYTEMMNEARSIATQRMIDEAQGLGADAIVNVRFASSAIMQGAAEVIAYGTAVRFA